jgi:putative solute:sodium symporter small subunit
MDESQRREYWRSNLRLMSILLAVWFCVSFLFGILLVVPLNNIVINGFPLGFWFAQQGSIVTFVILIGVYVWRMERLDDHYGVGREEEQRVADEMRRAREQEEG